MKYITFIAISIFLLVSCSEDEPQAPEVISLSIKTPPTKTLYKPNETLDLSGLVITLFYNNKESLDVEFDSFEENGITTSANNGSEITESLSLVITHNKSGETTLQEITINPVVEVIVKTSPSQTNYLKGELLDITGMEITIVRENGNTEDLILSEFDNNGLIVSPENGTEIDETITELTISHSQSGKSTTQNIIINSVLSLAIKTPPNNIQYYSGENINIDGLSITLNLDNGDTKVLKTSDFQTYNITTDPSNGGVLTNSTSNMIILHEESNQTVSQPITLLVLTDIDGNTYSHSKIGEQLWMAENLKTTKYQNGDYINTTNPANLDISNEDFPQYQWSYNGDDNNIMTHGRLYTQYVASDNRNICPEGWHIPSQEEYEILISYLIENGYNYDGSRSGNKLGKAIASTLYWDSYTFAEGVPGNVPETNNSSGFNGLGSGTRVNFDPFFTGQGVTTNWWSSDSDDEGNGIAFGIQNFVIEAGIVTIGDKNTGASCRCIRD